MISFAPAAKAIRVYFNRNSPEPDFAHVAGALVNANGTIGAKVDSNGNLVFTGETLNSVSDALTANSGGVQAGATALPSSVNRFTTVGGAGYSAVLPVAAAGSHIVVINGTSTSLNVYPASGDAINALSANAAFAVAGNTAATFYSTVAGHWNTLSSAAPGTLTGIVINGATSASGNFDLSGSNGTTKTTTGRTTIGGPLSHKTVNSAVAAAGSTNADAAALASVRVQHVSSDSAAKGVILPTGVAGDVLTIINDSATACKLYPEASGNVNGATTTSGSVTIPASKGVVAHCTVALTWIVFDLAAKSS